MLEHKRRLSLQGILHSASLNKYKHRYCKASCWDGKEEFESKNQTAEATIDGFIDFPLSKDIINDNIYEIL